MTQNHRRQSALFTGAALTILLAFVGLGAQGCPPAPVPPPQPDVGAGGSPGIGGAVVVDAAPPAVGGSPGVGGAAPECTSTCCRSCQVLRDHGCREGQPTAKGATCEDRNCSIEAAKLPTVMQLSDLTACTTLACLQKPGKGKRGVACEGGR
jgi:hypothetical protein